jgi:hypothetical protein
MEAPVPTSTNYISDLNKIGLLRFEYCLPGEDKRHSEFQMDNRSRASLKTKTHIYYIRKRNRCNQTQMQ